MDAYHCCRLNFFNETNSLIVVYLQLFSVTCALVCETNAWWFWRRRHVSSSQCPSKGNILALIFPAVFCEKINTCSNYSEISLRPV